MIKVAVLILLLLVFISIIAIVVIFLVKTIPYMISALDEHNLKSKSAQGKEESSENN